MTPVDEETILYRVSAASGLSPSAVRQQFGRGFAWVESLDPAERGWRVPW